LRPLLSTVYKYIKFFEELLNSLTVAVLLLTAMYIWSNLPLNFIMEETFTKATVKIADVFGRESPAPYGMDDVMFINVGHSSAIVDDTEGTHVIADRAKLDTLMQLLHRHSNPKQIIVCDLYFDVTSDQDWKLQSAMAEFPNLLSTVKTNWFGDISPNVLRAGASGTTGFRPPRTPFMIFSNSMVKFHLTDQNCVKTIPVLMYERLNNLHAACLDDALKIGDDWFFNTILINEELGRGIPKAVYEDQVLTIENVIRQEKENSKDFISQLESKQFIMIGEFEKDQQPTTFGDKPGTMVIFDIFLSLQQKENRISAGWLLLTVTFLTLLIYNRFYHFNILKKYMIWLDERTTVLGFKALPAIDWILFYLMILCSAVFFHVYMEAVCGILFLAAIAWLRIYMKARYVKLLQFKRSGRRWSARALFTFLFIKPGFKSDKA
jgi:hypothetical protein